MPSRPMRAPWLSVALLLICACSSTPSPSGQSSGVVQTGTTFTCDAAADCAGLDNGDPCDGTWACAEGVCAFDPASVVRCDAKDDTACSVATCDPSDGTCKPQARPDGTLCDDGEPCSLGDRCKAGACAAGAVSICECSTTADCADDGDKCNGTPLCDTQSFPHRCVTNPASAVTCKAGDDACKPTACDPKTGQCTPTPKADGAACDDGDACTSGDACQGGVCEGATDTCSCTQDSDCSDADGDPCTGVPYCDTKGGKGACKTNPATVVTCSSKADTDCTKNQCNPATGACTLTPIKDESPCDDGDSCTKGETCVGGSCAGGTDTCKCAADIDCAGTDDGDKCNGLPFCNKATGKCETNPATVVVCATAGDTECAKNVCLTKTGQCAVLARSQVKLVGCVDVELGGLVGKQCVFKQAAKPGTGSYACSDDNPCTSGDSCDGKVCKGKVTCACSKDSDCVDTDGDLCNGAPFCDKTVGQCKPNPASVVYCSKKDDTACEKAACNPKTGTCALQPAKGGLACDDGDACTTQDACDGKGGCAGGAKASCDDKDPCTQDSCDAKVGCKHLAKSCEDGNACTDDSCDATTGQCKNAAKKDGFVCNADDNGCTVADACSQGSCVAGEPMVCSAKVGACEVQQCVSKGPSTGECVTQAAKDDSPCPDAAGACLLGATCKSGSCLAGKTPRLFSLLHGKTGEDAFYADVAVGIDGDIVAVGGRRVSATSKSMGWYVAQLSPLGKSRWAKVVDGNGESLLTYAKAVARPSDGATWVLGARYAGKRIDTHLYRYDPTGKILSAKSLDKAGDSTGPMALAEAPTGGVVGIANVRPTGQSKTCLLVFRMTPIGTLGWTKTYCIGADASLATDVALTATSAVMTVKAKQGGSWLPGVRVVSLTDGTPKHGYLLANDTWSPAGVVHVPGVGLNVFGLKPGAPSVLGLDPDGKVNGLESPLLASFQPAKPALLAKGGASVIAGAANANAALAKVDRLGNLQWTVNYPTPLTSEFSAVAPLGDDLVAVGAASYQDGSRRPWIVRASAFGTASCGSLGKCAGLTAKGCDDQNECTLDVCDPKLGCVHDSPDAYHCTSPEGCSRFGVCTAGKCGSAKQGTLFAQRFVWDNTKGHAVIAMAELPDDGVRVWTFKPSPGQVASAEMDRWGAAQVPTVAGVCSGFTFVERAEPRADGSVVILGSQGKLGTTAQRPAFCIMTKALKPATPQVRSVTAKAPQHSSYVTAAAQAKNGATFLVGVHRKLLTSGGSKNLLLVSKLDVKDEVVWTTAHEGTAPLSASRAAPLLDGGLAVVGNAIVGGAQKHHGVVATLNHDGTLRFISPVDNKLTEAFLAVAELSSGAVLAAGGGDVNSSSWRSIRLAVSPKTGKKLWQVTPTQADLSYVFSATPSADGGAVLAGNVNVFGEQRAYMERVDAKGARVWRRDYAFVAPAGQPTGAVPTFAKVVQPWSGGYVLGAEGRYKESGGVVHRPGVIRTDFGGYAGCLASGACLGKKADACDDKDPCTVDWCDAKLGCKSQKISGCL